MVLVEDSDPETPDTIAESLEEIFGVALDLYDAYASAVSSALIHAPELFSVGFKEFLIAPTHAWHPDDLMHWSERDTFFLSGLDGLVIPALSEALATM